MRSYVGLLAAAVMSIGTLTVACDGARLGASSSANGGGDPGATLFGSDAGAGEGGIDGLHEADASVDRTGWIMDSMADVSVSTVAGGPVPGRANGTGAQAQFNNPTNLAIAPDGNLIVTDFDNGELRRVTPGGEVSTLVPAGVLLRPFGIAYAGDGQLYVETDVDPVGDLSDRTGTLWKIDPVSGGAIVLAANVGRPRGLVPQGDGKMLVSDVMQHTIRLFDPQTGQFEPVAGLEGSAAFADAPGPQARFHEAYGIAALPGGDIVLADRLNHRVRRIGRDGTVSTLAGDGTRGMVDGPAGNARFNSPKDVAVDAEGNVYVTDSGNFLVRRIGADGTVKTVAGDGAPGAVDGDGKQARFYGIEGVAITPDGKTLFLADGTNGQPNLPYHRVRRINLP